MYGSDILCETSKGIFEIPHKISDPYIRKYVFYSGVKIKSSYIEMVSRTWVNTVPENVLAPNDARPSACAMWTNKLNMFKIFLGYWGFVYLLFDAFLLVKWYDEKRPMESLQHV